MTYTKPALRMRRPATLGDGDDLFSLWMSVDNSPIDASLVAPTDNVNQTVSGTTTTAADFTTVNGVCKPQNFPALAMVEEFQSQMNRVAQVKGYAKIAADGAVGPATLALFRQVQSAAAGSVGGDASTCMGVAPDVDVLAAQVQAFADTLGAPAQVSPAISLSVPTIVTKSGKIVVPPNAGIAGSLATLSTTEKIALLGVAGGIGYLLLMQRKKKRRK